MEIWFFQDCRVLCASNETVRDGVARRESRWNLSGMSFVYVKNRNVRAALLSPASFLTSFRSGHCMILFWLVECTMILPQWGASDAEIKVPSVEKTELKRSPFKAWSRSVYSHTCYAYCQGFLPCLFLPFRSIHLLFFPKKLLPISPVCWPWLTRSSCVGTQNKIGHRQPAGGRFPCWVPAEYK